MRARLDPRIDLEVDPCKVAMVVGLFNGCEHPLAETGLIDWFHRAFSLLANKISESLVLQVLGCAIDPLLVLVITVFRTLKFTSLSSPRI